MPYFTKLYRIFSLKYFLVIRVDVILFGEAYATTEYGSKNCQTIYRRP
jgi:hypothetical protein